MTQVISEKELYFIILHCMKEKLIIFMLPMGKELKDLSCKTQTVLPSIRAISKIMQETAMVYTKTNLLHLKETGKMVILQKEH